MDGICKDFERALKKLNPTLPSITYEINDLNSYIDAMPDLSALVFDPQTKTYLPCSKAWIKNEVYNNLRKASKGGRY
jgi:hypothetical protein